MKHLPGAVWAFMLISFAAAQEAPAPAPRAHHDAAMPIDAAAAALDEVALERIQLLTSRLRQNRNELVSFAFFGAGSAEPQLKRDLWEVDLKLETLNRIRASGRWSMALADSEVPSWDIYLEAEESIQVKAYARIDPTLGEYADHFKVAGGASDLSTDVQRIPWLVGVVADDRGHDVLGTAFHVRGGWFLTAAHVVQGRVRAGLETRCITAPEPGDITPKNNLVIDPNSVRFHKKLDVCRFRLLDPRQFPEPALALDAPDCNCAPKPGPVPCHRADIVGYGGGSAFPIRTLNALLIGNDSQTIRGLGNTWRCYSGAPLLGPGDSIIGLMFKQSSEDTVDGEPIVLRVDSVNAFTAISLEAIVDFLPGSPQ